MWPGQFATGSGGQDISASDVAQYDAAREKKVDLSNPEPTSLVYLTLAGKRLYINTTLLIGIKIHLVD